jgi:VWFA-related protein
MRCLAGICLAMLVACPAWAPVWSQDVQTPTFRSTTELVLVDVQVVHKKMKTPAPLLQQGHFQVYEDGQLQEIRSFSRDQLPLSVVLLFDLTDSVRPVLQRLARGAKSALTHLKPEDEVAVIAYGASAQILDGFTKDRRRTIDAIERASYMKSNEAAFFNEAVYQAAEELRQSESESNRRVIIWLTDNLSNVPTEWMRAHLGGSVAEGSLHTQEDAVRALHESGTMVAPLLLTDAASLVATAPERAFEALWYKSHPPGDAKKYAEWTGGQAMQMGGKNVEQRLADLIDELRSRYTIGFQPSQSKPPGTLCKLKVALAADGPLHPKDWNVLARAGYYRK